MPEKSRAITGHPGAAAQLPSPLELFAACEAREMKIDQAHYREGVSNLLEHNLFMTPVFDKRFLGGYGPFDYAFEKMYPFDFTLAPPVDLRISHGEWRYRELLAQLKRQPDKELRWLLIARWLEHEGVSQHRDFLPAPILANLLRRYRKRVPLSPTSLYQCELVRTWLPYFQRTRAAYNSIKKSVLRVRQALLANGYEATSIDATIHTRSNIQAICCWLEIRKHIQASTLHNAYSRVRGHRRKKWPLDPFEP